MVVGIKSNCFIYATIKRYSVSLTSFVTDDAMCTV